MKLAPEKAGNGSGDGFIQEMFTWDQFSHLTSFCIVLCCLYLLLMEQHVDFPPTEEDYR
jgi:hypothetical protein